MHKLKIEMRSVPDHAWLGVGVENLQLPPDT